MGHNVKEERIFIVENNCVIRPDIFNFSSFKNPDRNFQEMEKKKI